MVCRDIVDEAARAVMEWFEGQSFTSVILNREDPREGPRLVFKDSSSNEELLTIELTRGEAGSGQADIYFGRFANLENLPLCQRRRENVLNRKRSK